MSLDLVQIFPGRRDGRIVHRTWTLDLDAVRRRVPEGSMDLRRITREASEMIEHFPRWLLTLRLGGQTVTCRSCKGLLVFDRGLRCVSCDEAAVRIPAGSQLAWFGLLPPIGVDGLERVRAGLRASPPENHVLGSRDDLGTYLLVPLLAGYPPEFPRSPVDVTYLPGFFRIPGIPRDAASHVHHLYGGGRMCLFASGQWQPSMTCRQVLQQRAYAHVIKLLNVANGKRDAFKIVS